MSNEPVTADPPPGPGRTPAREQAAVLAVIACGGVIGACARYGAGLVWPTDVLAFPWTTFWINVIGCFAMGVLMVVVGERFTPHPLVRPFLGTGILGGFTTFSTATLDTQRLLDGGRAAVGLGYALVTLLAAIAAVWTATDLTRRLFADRGRA